MAQVTLTIHGRPYQIGCDDGQEQHLLGLAAYLDRRVRDLSKSVGQVGEARLLVMVSLLIADELAETRLRLEELESGAAGAPAAAPGAAAAETAAAERLDEAAQQLDFLAARLEAS